MYVMFQLIDEMTEGREPFVHRLTKASRDILDQQIKAALDQSGINEELKSLQNREKELKRKQAELEKKRKEEDHRRKKEQAEMEKRRKELANDEERRKKLEKEMAKKEEDRKKREEEDERKRKQLEDDIRQEEERKKEIERKEEELRKKLEEKQRNGEGSAPDSGGCYPGTASFVDLHGRLRRMDSLRIGDEVHVISNKEIRLEPVITFIHYHPDVMQEFLKITTKRNKVLKITEDHLMFVEKRGQETAIPAREVQVGDIVYVRGKHGVEKDAVQGISTVYEKGVYAPVTVSGTILVNDVHTSCYFDVLSHEWSHRAMGVARAVHYVSPWMLQWISGVGQKDGFPGWCRLAHKMLSLLD